MTKESQRKILIVDDDDDFLESLARLLKLEGYGVWCVSDAQGAIKVIESTDVQVALVDIRLGAESGGVGVVGDLRRINPDLVCLMITAYASVDSAVKALKAGAYDYLSKPFHDEDLLATLDRCFHYIQLVNEKKLNTIRLQQKQQMEAIGQLTSGVAHDFNNILAVLHSNLRLLEQRIGGGYPQFSELVDEALAATSTGRDLTTRLLNFSHGQKEEVSTVVITDIVAGIITILQRTLGKKWTVSLHAPSPAGSVTLPVGQLETSLLNLALNARDAMPGGGLIRIAIRNTQIGAIHNDARPLRVPGNYVELSVADTGEGMTESVRKRALEPFFSTKRRGDGNGLGLAMVNNFVRGSGGWIKIDSTPGRGTRIAIYLPVAPADTSEGTKA